MEDDFQILFIRLEPPAWTYTRRRIRLGPRELGKSENLTVRVTRWWVGVDNDHYTENARAQN